MKKAASVDVIARFVAKGDAPKDAVRLPGGPRELAALAFLRVGDKITPLTHVHLRGLTIGVDALAKLALTGTAALVPVEVEEVTRGIFSVTNERVPFVSGYALDLGKVPGLPRLGKQGALVAVPNAHLLLVRPLTPRGALDEALRALLPAVVGTWRDGPGPLTKDLYWVREGAWKRLRVEIEGAQLRMQLTRELERLLDA